jgi:hypothetical protein
MDQIQDDYAIGSGDDDDDPEDEIMISESYLGPCFDNAEVNETFRGYASNRSMIKSLNLDVFNFEEETANILANGVLRFAPLRELRISFEFDCTSHGWRKISDALTMNANARLEFLSIRTNRDQHWNASHSLFSDLLLCHTNNLKSFSLAGSIGGMTIEDWQALFQHLLDSNWMLEELILHCNGNHETNDPCSFPYITDEVTRALANALVNNSSLRELHLYGNPDVTAAGWASFSWSILRIPHSALEVIDLGDNRINDNAMISIAYALANNNMLKRLYFDPDPIPGYSDGVTSNGFAALTHLLCNKSSVLSTYHSNHTLEVLGRGVWDDDEKLPRDLASLLTINRENNWCHAARLKVIKSHFCGRDINMQPFADMDPKIRVHIIDWIARDDDDKMDLLNLVNGCVWCIIKQYFAFDMNSDVE